MLEQGARRDRCELCERMLGRAHHLQLVGAAHLGRERRQVRVALDEAQIQAALEDAVLHLLRVGDEEPRHDGRKARLELADELRQQIFADRHAGADQERPGDMPGELLEARIELAREPEDAFRVLEREDPGRGERDAAARPVEQARVVLLLELADLEGHGRLRHEERLRRLGEGEVLRNRVEDLETAISHPRILREKGVRNLF